MRTRWIPVFFAAFLTAALAPGASPAQQRVMVIPIEGELQLGLAPYVERLTLEAAESGASLIIYRINTFGGRLDAAVTIRDAIINSGVPTAAFIDKRAISAGVLISLAADRIYMHPQSTIGAAEPVTMGIAMQSGKASEKTIYYWSAELRSTAEKNGRDPKIAAAFADRSVAIDGLVDEGKLLTLTAAQALELGIADAEASTLQDVLAAEGLEEAQISSPGMSTAEKLAGFFSRGMVSSILLTIGLLGVFFEIKTPGFGLPGIVALVAFALFFGSHSLVNLAGWGELLLFAAGVILLAVEIFVIPGFGITGVLGILALVSSLYLSLIGRFVQPSDFISGARILAASFIATFVIILVALRFLPKYTPLGRLILKTTEDEKTGFRSSPGEYKGLVGLEGIALTTLRPSGTAMIGGSRYSVVSEGEFIERDERIRVRAVEGYRIVVEKA